MRAFVTGSTGLLGTNLVRELRAAGHEVRALARSAAKASAQFEDPGVEVVEGDLADVAGFAPAMEGCDVLFHLAAFFREYYQPGDYDDELRRLNVDATVRVLEAAAAHGVGAAVHTSSSGVVGRGVGGAPGDEWALPSPASTANRYFASKVAAEMAVDAFLRRSPMPVVLVRPGWMYGPYDAAPTGAGEFFLQICRGAVPAIPRGHVNVVDARDVAAAMIVAAEKGAAGERYNLAGPPSTLAGIVTEIAAAAGRRTPRTAPDPLVNGFATMAEWWARMRGRPALVTRKALDSLRGGHDLSSAKAERELGFTVRPFTETATDELAWFRTRGMLPPA